MTNKTKKYKAPSPVFEEEENITNDILADDKKDQSESFSVQEKEKMKKTKTMEETSIEEQESMVEEEFDSALKKKPKMSKWKRRLLKLGATALLGIVTGSVLGYWYYNSIYGDMFDPDSFTAEQIKALYDNEDDWFTAATGRKLSESEKKSWVSLANVNPTELTPSQNVNLALYNLKQARKYRAESNGQVTATVGIKTTQSVYGLHEFDGTTYTSISMSFGTFAKLAHRSTLNVNTNMITHIDGTTKSSTEPVWNSSTERKMTKDEFIEFTGGLPSDVNPYIVSTKTVINDSKDLIEAFTGEDGKTYYKFTISLKPVESTVLYVKQMKMVGNLDDYPIYKGGDIKQTFTIDEKWNLDKISVFEHYSQIVGMKAACEGTLLTTFTDIEY